MKRSSAVMGSTRLAVEMKGEPRTMGAPSRRVGQARPALALAAFTQSTRVKPLRCASAVTGFMCALLCWPLLAAPPSATAAREIEHLLGYLSSSGCQFYRNGKWYPAAKAGEHLRKKYDYLVKKDLVNSAEQFVERAATRSSQSGQPYRVRCEDGPVPSSSWLFEELQRYRQPRAR